MMAQAADSLHFSNVSRRLDDIRRWLEQSGAEVLEPTNEWEVLRFRANGDTSIVYRNKSNHLNYTGESATAIRAFLRGQKWRGAQRTKRARGSSSPIIAAIRARDGNDCFACAWPVSEHDESRDHLVPLTSGGPNHIANSVLMHITCNQQCSSMSAPEKIRMHVEARLARASA